MHSSIRIIGCSPMPVKPNPWKVDAIIGRNTELLAR